MGQLYRQSVQIVVIMMIQSSEGISLCYLSLSAVSTIAPSIAVHQGDTIATKSFDEAELLRKIDEYQRIRSETKETELDGLSSKEIENQLIEEIIADNEGFIRMQVNRLYAQLPSRVRGVVFYDEFLAEAREQCWFATCNYDMTSGFRWSTYLGKCIDRGLRRRSNETSPFSIPINLRGKTRTLPVIKLNDPVGDDDGDLLFEDVIGIEDTDPLLIEAAHLCIEEVLFLLRTKIDSLSDRDRLSSLNYFFDGVTLETLAQNLLLAGYGSSRNIGSPLTWQAVSLSVSKIAMDFKSIIIDALEEFQSSGQLNASFCEQLIKYTYQCKNNELQDLIRVFLDFDLHYKSTNPF